MVENMKNTFTLALYDSFDQLFEYRIVKTKEITLIYLHVKTFWEWNDFKTNKNCTVNLDLFQILSYSAIYTMFYGYNN